MVRSAMEIKQSRARGNPGELHCYLYIDRSGLDKVTFEQNTAVREQLKKEQSWKNNTKVLKWNHNWHAQGTTNRGLLN